jgi:hypothetical protein
MAEPKWWKHARRLRKGGASWRAIAAEIGVSDRAVRYACSAEVRKQMSAYFKRYYSKPANKRYIIRGVLDRRQANRALRDPVQPAAQHPQRRQHQPARRKGG